MTGAVKWENVTVPRLNQSRSNSEKNACIMPQLFLNKLNNLTFFFLLNDDLVLDWVGLLSLAMLKKFMDNS